MQLNKEIIQRLIGEGYIMANPHPDYPLRILNYTRKAQFERYWNEHTLMSRGLVIDDDYNVIARPFVKFFNYEELQATPEIIPNTNFEVYDKMDGSLGILFFYYGLWHIATRGSFVSDQAIRAKKILDAKYDLTYLNTANTYLFEIIYPENRIVVDYGDDEKLVLLGIVNTDTGFDFTHKQMQQYAGGFFEIVKHYDGVNDIAELKQRNLLNQEGYVLRYENGFRLKVKFEDYCRLHSIITNVSTKDIWVYLRDGKDMDELLDRTPDEFDDWVRNQITMLTIQFNDIVTKEKMRVELIRSTMTDPNSKKEFAEKILKYKAGNSAVAFKIFDGKAYADIVWRLIEPKWSKPFFKEEEV